MISDTVLVLAEPLGGLSAERVASALGRGLEDARTGLERTGLEASRAGAHANARERRLSADLLAVEEPPEVPRAWWGSRWGSDAQERMLAARAVVIVTERLDERTLAGSLAFEVGTSARQAGVPAYAVTAENDLDRFDARMLDLQVVLEASSTRALTAAGRKLARLV